MSRKPLVSSDDEKSRSKKTRPVRSPSKPTATSPRRGRAPRRRERPEVSSSDNVVEIARPRRRRRVRRVVVVVALALVAGALAKGGDVVLHSSYFSVTDVVVTGEIHESAAQVIAASGLANRPAMIDVSSSAISERLARFPWIDRVSVVTHWPHRVDIAVSESHAVGVTFIGAHQLFYVGDQGQDLGSAPLNANLPTLVSPLGLTGEKAWVWKGSAAALVASQLPVAFSAQVREIHQSSSGSVSLVMTTPLTFVLGPPSDLGAKFVAIASAIAHASFAPGDVVDVSTPSEIAVSGPSSSS